MPRKPAISPAQAEAIRNARSAGASIRSTARSVGVSSGAVVRELARIKDRVRTAAEFRGLPELTAPQRRQPETCWSLEQIREARDMQLRGEFSRPVALARAMATDDAIFVARNNRVAPQSALSTELKSSGGARGDGVLTRARRGVFVARTTLHSIARTLADHGIAIGYNDWEVSENGDRTDFKLKEWPLEFVKWNHSTEALETQVKNGGARETILHGNGRWTVFRKYEVQPWAEDAAILPGAFIWSVHANALMNWASSALSHGRSKIIGELPEGVPYLDENGALTPEAQAFLAMMQALESGQGVAGIRPPGSKTDFISDSSSNWQVFVESVQSREKAAARIYLGTDAILGSVGGAPGVDISELFKVASTRIQGDLEVIENALYTGVYQPWTAINIGDSRYAPRLSYLVPDPDAAQRSKQEAEKHGALVDLVARYRAAGAEITQPFVDALAKDLGVRSFALAPGGPPVAAPARSFG